jgi:hypothetical protein
MGGRLWQWESGISGCVEPWKRGGRIAHAEKAEVGQGHEPISLSEEVHGNLAGAGIRAQPHEPLGLGLTTQVAVGFAGDNRTVNTLPYPPKR